MAALTRRETLFLLGAGAASAARPAISQTGLFVSGEGSFHTYRIPALLPTEKGTLLAFNEGRRGRIPL